jgi:hypothetical protein
MANLFKADLGTLGPALGQLSAAGVTNEMWERIGRSDGEYARVIFEAIMAKMSGASDEPVDTITISANATAEQLIADAKAESERAGIPFTYFDDDVISIIRHDLELVKGKKLQVLARSFGRYWTTREGRSFQQGQGCDGNAAAYLVWVTQTKREGWSVSIANTDDRLFPGDGRLYAPCFGRGESSHGFGLDVVHDEWLDDRVLVAFRVI